MVNDIGITSDDELREEVLLSWTSPSRVFKRRSREFYTNVGAIVFFVFVILVFAKDFAFIFAIVSLLFIIYVLSTVPPEDVHHRITSLGIESAGHFYRWETIHEFWFDAVWGQKMLVLQPYIGARTIILLGKEDQEKIRNLIAKYIPYREEPEKTWIDNASRWLSQKIPLERQSS